jgi:hypothetical protein
MYVGALSSYDIGTLSYHARITIIIKHDDGSRTCAVGQSDDQG